MSKIALVDNDKNNLDSVAITREAEGFDLETYNDGWSALKAFNRRLLDGGWQFPNRLSKRMMG